jgi:N,N'-diacetyllegionaminate synthase
MARTMIIAEVGVNHNGKLTLAKQLVRTAKECGADVVKFQTFHIDRMVSKYTQMAEYQKTNTGMVESQKEMLRKLTLSKEDFLSLADYCKEVDIQFLSTPFDIDSMHFLMNLQDMWKIPSGEITNYPYLVEIARTGKDVILSTGMSTLEEVDAARTVLRDNGAGKITILHCTTNYPTPMDEVNLKAMITLKEHFGCDIGYSDHTLGIEVSIAAVAMGAAIIEKHFTLDHAMKGPDHKASLEPDELARMIKAIRNVEAALGSSSKIPSKSEMKNISVVRKSIIASRAINSGEILSEDNLTTKRPGTGISPMRWNEIIGTTAIRDFDEDELIEL